MKKLIYLLALLLIMNSCVTNNIEVDKRLMDFAESIIDSPEKMYNLKHYYPNFYDVNYINKTLKDSLKIKQIVDFINNKYKVSNKSVEMHGLLFDNEDIKTYIKTNTVIEEKDLFCFSLVKYDIGVEFIFVNKNNKYFICNINYIIFPYKI